MRTLAYLIQKDDCIAGGLDSIQGIFSSRKKAEEYVQGEISKLDPSDWVIDVGDNYWMCKAIYSCALFSYTYRLYIFEMNKPKVVAM